jgi:sporulation protein YlmC with PRC-barrel domain
MRATSESWVGTYRLSDLRGLPVHEPGSRETIGRLEDLVMVESGGALAARLLVLRSSGERTRLVPWEGTSLLDQRSIQLGASPRTGTHQGDGVPLRLRRDVLGRTILDREGGRLGKVRDIRLTVDGSRFVVLDLDISTFAALARRVRIQFRTRRTRFIPWHGVVPDSIRGGRQPLRLRVSTMDIDRSSG